MVPESDLIDTRRSLGQSRLRWSILFLVPVTAILIGLGFRGNQIYQQGREFGTLSARYEGWAEALWWYEPSDPVKQKYVRDLSIYYRTLAHEYHAAHLRPWIGAELLVEPPDRPPTLPGRPDPATGEPPEVAEALDDRQSRLPGQ